MEAQTLATLFIAILLFYVPSIWRNFIHNRKLRSIPTIGPSGSFASYIGALRFLRHGQEMLREGSDKSWFVVASGGNLIDEIRRAPEDVLSVIEAARETWPPKFQLPILKDLLLDLTVGPEPFDDRFHGEVVKGPLTRNIGARLADIQEEMAIALEDYIPAIKAEGQATGCLLAYPCRNSDWMKLNKSFTLDLVKSSIILGFVPAGLRPILFSGIVVPLLRAIPKGIRRGAKHPEPLIRERLQQEAQHGMDWPDKPNDVISWVLDATKDRQRNVRSIVRAILMINFASLHTIRKTKKGLELATEMRKTVTPHASSLEMGRGNPRVKKNHPYPHPRKTPTLGKGRENPSSGVRVPKGFRGIENPQGFVRGTPSYGPWHQIKST
ncbi:hypothetical protein JOM56_012577 [Amanita muscaria]